MKLQQIIENIIDESQAADQAKSMGLAYAGYGRWKDPKTGKIVAKTVQDKLVKVEDDIPDGQSPHGNAPATGEAPEADAEFAPGSNYGGDIEKNEPEAPTISTALERMLAAAGGDSMKLRKTLVKKFREGNPSAQKWLDQLDSYDAREKNDIQASLAKMDQKKADDLAAKKAKYATKYPSPQI